MVVMRGTRTAELVRLARAIALDRHAGQVDKAGRPYGDHLRRVAERLPEELQPVGWLHDVLEDTATSAADLAELGIPARLIAAVEALTRRADEAPASYYRRVRADAIALQVKSADLSDNADPARLAVLEPETRARLVGKYDAARLALGLDRDTPDA